MTTISLRITGATELQTGFNKYAQTIAPVCGDSIRAALERAVKVSPGWLGGNSYTTPETANGNGGYVRTGVLGRSVEIDREGLSYRIKSAAYREGTSNEYSTYVIGKADGTGQAGVHVGRWPTLRSAVDAEVDKLTTPGQGLDADLGKAAKEAGL